MAVLADVERARSGYEWWLLRVALVGVAVLCLRPIVRTLIRPVAVPATVSARRARA